ncbi:TPA: hypothetical protein RJD83_000279 [Legionella pneumophila]|nr:hypothetical protein [Legionella pneumophila]
MAVKSQEKEDKLILEIDNGDLSKLNDVMEKWGFKDYQSFMRFAVSILLLNEEKSVGIKLDGLKQDIAPASDLLKGK